MKPRSFFPRALLLLASFASLISLAPAQAASVGQPNITPAMTPASVSDWTGVITFTKTLNDATTTDEPVMGRLDEAKNRVKNNTSRTYLYAGRLFFQGTRQGSRMECTVSFNDNDREWGEQRVWDSCHAFNDEHFFIDVSSDERLTTGKVRGEPDGFNLRVNEQNGTYGFSFTFPDAPGYASHEIHKTHTGYCQPKNNEPFNFSEHGPTKIDGESVRVEDQKFDPKKDTTLEGTITRDTSSAGIKSFVYTISWRLTRNPEKLLITDMYFEHPVFPNPEDWQRVELTRPSIDGNPVKVVTKILNLSNEKKSAVLDLFLTYKGDKWDGARPDEQLPKGMVAFTLEPGEEKAVEYLWDTNGCAWYPDGRPALIRRVRAAIFEKIEHRDERTEAIRFAPKPVILLHGVWNDWKIFETWQNVFTTLHSYDWKACAIGEQPDQGLMKMGRTAPNTLAQNARELDRYVRYVRTTNNAWHVDILAHTSGGLVAREYIHELMPKSPDEHPVAMHLLMLGTPNGGSFAADLLRAGAASVFKDKIDGIEELGSGPVEEFNKRFFNRRGTRYSALIGNMNAFLDLGPGNSDGFVSVQSAGLGIIDKVVVPETSDGLLGLEYFQSFAMKRIALDPHAAAAELQPEFGGPSAQASLADGRAVFQLTALDDAAVAGGPRRFRIAQVTPGPATEPFCAEVKLAPRQTLDVPFAVEPEAGVGLTFIADPIVSATLLDEAGKVVAKNIANDPGARTHFRTLYSDQPVTTPGKLKVRFQNMGAEAQVILLVVWPAHAKTSSAVIASLR